MARTVMRLRRAVETFEATAVQRLLAAAAGIVLVVLLVPLLELMSGPAGVFGPSIPLLFLVPVLLTAALAGRGAGVGVALAAAGAWDWYFIQPHDRITIASLGDATALLVFLGIALLTGQMATVARSRARDALRQARTAETLYELSAALIGRSDVKDVLGALVERLHATLPLDACAVLLVHEATETVETVAAAGHFPPEYQVEQSRSVTSIARWVQRHGRQRELPEGESGLAGTASVLLRGRVEFWPLVARGRSIGVLQVLHCRSLSDSPDLHVLLGTLVNGVALAMEQDRLSKEEEDARLAREADRLKSSLLASLSHDLRTPLAGIKAAASSLLQPDVQWTDSDREEFLGDIDAEADRLSHLVANLLDLSRIEAGAITPMREWEDIGELVTRVLSRLAPQLARHEVRSEGERDLPSVRIDAVQMEQVLTNLLENAAKYSLEGTTITVSLGLRRSDATRGELCMAVADEGRGIREREQANIFDRFYRVTGTSDLPRGTGMGLAIVKGLVEAHGGSIRIDSEPGRGSVFLLTIPVDIADGDAAEPLLSSSSGERAL